MLRTRSSKSGSSHEWGDGAGEPQPPPCAQHKVPQLLYLTDLLTNIAAGWLHSRIDELLPDNWMALHYSLALAASANTRNVGVESCCCGPTIPTLLPSSTTQVQAFEHQT